MKFKRHLGMFFNKDNRFSPRYLMWQIWRRGVVVITTVQLHSTNPELSFWKGSNPIHVVLEIRDVEDLWQWSQLEIRLNTFRRLIIPQTQFIIITISKGVVSKYNMPQRPKYKLNRFFTRTSCIKNDDSMQK